MKLPMLVFLIFVEKYGTNAKEALIAAGYHPKIVTAKADKANRRRYVNAGVVVDRCWLTRAGEKFIEALGQPEFGKRCPNKRRYPDQATAVSAAVAMQERGFPDSRAYPCKVCPGWHLTTQGPEKVSSGTSAPSDRGPRSRGGLLPAPPSGTTR